VKEKTRKPKNKARKVKKTSENKKGEESGEEWSSQVIKDINQYILEGKYLREALLRQTLLEQA
jgi:hypothetical protein